METKPLKIGTSLISRLSEDLYNKKSMVFEELIINSLDAGSKKISITIEEKNNKIERILFLDDGKGMINEDIENCIGIFKSEKDKKEYILVEDFKRPIRGKFGVGKISTKILCNKMIIETWNSEKQISFEFDYKNFEKDRNTEDIKIPFREEKSHEKINSGTRVILEEITNLSIEDIFIDDKEKESIITTLEKNLPLEEKYIEIFFNYKGNKKLRPFNYLDYSRNKEKLLFLDDDEKNEKINFEISSDIKGEIYIFNKNIPENKGGYGTFIKIKNRIINQGNTLNFIPLNTITHDQFFHRRVRIVVEANILEKYILLNRGYLREHSEVREFKKLLYEEIKKIWKKAYSNKRKRYTDYENIKETEGFYISKKEFEKKCIIERKNKITREIKEISEDLNLEEIKNLNKKSIEELEEIKNNFILSKFFIEKIKEISEDLNLEEIKNLNKKSIEELEEIKNNLECKIKQKQKVQNDLNFKKEYLDLKITRSSKIPKQIKEIAENLAKEYEKVSIIENSLRHLIITEVGKEFYNMCRKRTKESIDKLKNSRKRGNHDIFYTNLEDIRKFIENYHISFKNYFENLEDFKKKMEDLIELRNAISHNSNFYEDEKDKLTQIESYFINKIFK